MERMSCFVLCAIFVAGVFGGDVIDNSIYDHPQTKVVSSHVRSMKAIKTYITEEIVDFIVDDAKDRIESYNQSYVEIGDLRISFEQKLLGITMEGVLYAEKGRLSKPRSLWRIDHPSIEHKEESMIVTFSVSLSETEMIFDSYTASLLSFNDTGSFKMIIPQTNITVEVVVEYVPECTVRIGKLAVTGMSEPQFFVRGLETFKFLEEAISVLAAEEYERTIVDIAKIMATQKLKQTPVKTIICRHHQTLTEYSVNEFRLLRY